MTTRADQTSPSALDAIRELERTLGDTVQQRAFAAESLESARRAAAGLLAEAQARGEQAATDAGRQVRAEGEAEMAAIRNEAEREVEALRDRIDSIRGHLLAEMRAAVLPHLAGPGGG